MADEISRVEYYVATIPNKAGEGARVLAAFKEAGVNLAGLLGYRKTARNAEIIVVVDEKTPGIGAAGKKAGLTLGKRQKAFVVKGEDRVGAVAELGKQIGWGRNQRDLNSRSEHRCRPFRRTHCNRIVRREQGSQGTGERINC